MVAIRMSINASRRIGLSLFSDRSMFCSEHCGKHSNGYRQACRNVRSPLYWHWPIHSREKIVSIVETIGGTTLYLGTAEKFFPLFRRMLLSPIRPTG